MVSNHLYRYESLDDESLDSLGTIFRHRQSLALEIEQAEKQAAVLFRAFDVDAANDSCEFEDTEVLKDYPANSKHGLSPTTEQARDTTRGPAHSEARTTAKFESFLSTPLRLKYFRSLSPTILRNILRSPSVTLFSPESSFSGSNPGDTQETAEPGESFHLEHLPSTSMSESLFSDNEESVLDMFPITPPLSSRVPRSDSSAIKQRFSVLCATAEDSGFGEGSPSSPVVQDIPCTPDNVEKSQISSPSASVTKSGPDHPGKQNIIHNILVSPTAVNKFRRVVDELKGVEPDMDQSALMSSLRTCTARPVTTSISVSVLPNIDSQMGQDDLFNCRAPELSKNAVTLTSSTRCGLHHMQATIGNLEVLGTDFATLLAKRASREEAEARELRSLSAKLERLARRRRKLAQVVHNSV